MSSQKKSPKAKTTSRHEPFLVESVIEWEPGTGVLLGTVVNYDVTDFIGPLPDKDWFERFLQQDDNGPT